MITQNTELIPFWVCFAGLLNGIDWVIYGRLINLNLYIVVSSLNNNESFQCELWIDLINEYMTIFWCRLEMQLV